MTAGFGSRLSVAVAVPVEVGEVSSASVAATCSTVVSAGKEICGGSTSQTSTGGVLEISPGRMPSQSFSMAPLLITLMPPSMIPELRTSAKFSSLFCTPPTIVRGDQSGNCPLPRLASPVPSTLITFNSLRPRRKTIRVPSGDQVISSSSKLLLVTGVGELPSAFMM